MPRGGAISSTSTRVATSTTTIDYVTYMIHIYYRSGKPPARDKARAKSSRNAPALEPKLSAVPEATAVVPSLEVKRPVLPAALPKHKDVLSQVDPPSEADASAGISAASPPIRSPATKRSKSTLDLSSSGSTSSLDLSKQLETVAEKGCLPVIDNVYI